MNALGSLAVDFLVLLVDWFFLGSALAMAALYFAFVWVGFYSTTKKLVSRSLVEKELETV